MTLYSGNISNRGTVSVSELQHFTNFDLMPWRDVLEGWHVFHKMAAIDDLVDYISTKEEECKIERSFENDIMDVTFSGDDE
jgi:hypothetical protein